MKRLLKYLKDYKAQCIIAPLFKFLEACFEIVIPVFMKIIIDEGINESGTPNREIIVTYLVVMLVMAVLGLGVALVAQYFSAVAGMGFGTKLRTTAFNHLATLTNADIDKLGASTIVTRLTNDVNQSANAVNRFLRLFLRAPFIVLGTVVMSFVINVEMGVIVCLSIPFIVLVVVLVSKFTMPRYNAIQRYSDEVASLSKENVEGVRVIRAFGKQDNQVDKFGVVADELYGEQVGVSKISALLNPLTYAISNIAIVAVLHFGGGLVSVGNLTAGDITTLVNYILQILNAVVVLSNLVVILAKGQASAVRVADFLEMQPSFTDEGNTTVTSVADAPKVQFDNVTACYTQGKPVLENVSFAVPCGSTVGIIGGTGSGKTTLVSLIARLYEVTSGSVLVDGVDVRKYPFGQLRTKVSYAVQHATLFKGTVRSNLLFAKSDATDEQMNDALRTAQAYDFVYEKQGLDTVVAKGGANFSGGQRQRLNVARAILAGSDIIVLDDSSSALDYHTDYLLRTGLKKLHNTTFIVSQRVSSVVDADVIIVLEEGKVAGYGTHSQLYGNNAVYTEIFNSQTKREVQQ